MKEVFTSSHAYARKRRITTLVAACAIGFGTSSCTATLEAPVRQEAPSINYEDETVRVTTEQVVRTLGGLAVKGRGPKTGYSRDKFGSGWTEDGGCDTRNLILKRDLTGITFNSVTCDVESGILNDPYSGVLINFKRGKETSDDVQIDHVVALSNAWQMGTPEFKADTKSARDTRIEFANDPLNLRAVDGDLNNAKSDGDAATWLPPKKDFRCEFVAQQVVVKDKYDLRVTQAEHDVIDQILDTCPNQEFAIPN